MVLRVTKYHWVNLSLFLTVCKAMISRESALGALRPIGLIPINFFTGYKKIISRESALGTLRPVGLIPSNFFTGCKAIISRYLAQGALRHVVLIPCNIFYCIKGNNLKRFGPRGTKSHWFHPWHFSFFIFNK